MLCHESLEHINMRVVIHRCEQLGIGEIASDKVSFFCEVYIIGKQNRKSHTSTENKRSFSLSHITVLLVIQG